jgi:hypothetical protein
VIAMHGSDVEKRGRLWQNQAKTTSEVGHGQYGGKGLTGLRTYNNILIRIFALGVRDVDKTELFPAEYLVVVMKSPKSR